MGLQKLGITLAEQCMRYAKACGKSSILHTKPVCMTNFSELKSAPNFSLTIGDVAHFTETARMKLKMFSPQEVLEMKPSSFIKILEKRNDIPKEIMENLHSPEKLNLYDTLLSIDSVKKLPKAKREEIFKQLFGSFNNKTCEASAQLEIIPELLNKGYSLETLANLPITRANMNQIESLLKKKDGLIKKMWEFREKDIIERCKMRNATGSSLQMELGFNKEGFEDKSLRRILQTLNDSNARYLDECIEATGHPPLLPYWGKDTLKILNEFGGGGIDIMDRLFRRSHNYESVKRILGEEKLTDLTARLLEFKNFDKVKDINLETFDKLSIKDKKEFLNSFISAISPKEAAYSSQHNLMDISILKSKMKIFEDLDVTSNESFLESYNKIVKEILLKIPENERTIIKSTIDTKSYLRTYRKTNPIPTLVDDIQTVLPKGTLQTINGRKVFVTTMERKSNFGISTHRIPNEEAINVVEALEITDPKMLLCVGTKGGKRGLNFGESGYAIAVKPRKGCDWHVQAWSDIDSGNNASKNIYNFENIMLPMMGNHCGCIDLVPNEIKKILDLSQKEYTQRMLKLKNCTTLQDIEKIDKEMAQAIRKVIKEQQMYEGLIRPEPMGILVSEAKPLESIGDDILRYCETKNIPLIRVKDKNQVIADIPKELKQFAV